MPEEAEYIPTFVYNRVVREKEELRLRYDGAMAMIKELNLVITRLQEKNEKLLQLHTALKGIMEDV